jgi:hypothetical protein
LTSGDDQPEAPARDSDWSALLLGLQTTIGNAAVVRLIENGALHAGTSDPDRAAAEGRG